MCNYSATLFVYLCIYFLVLILVKEKQFKLQAFGMCLLLKMVPLIQAVFCIGDTVNFGRVGMCSFHILRPQLERGVLFL